MVIFDLGFRAVLLRLKVVTALGDLNKAEVCCRSIAQDLRAIEQVRPEHE